MAMAEAGEFVLAMIALVQLVGRSPRAAHRAPAGAAVAMTEWPTETFRRPAITRPVAIR
jgi:hypothetical protein